MCFSVLVKRKTPTYWNEQETQKWICWTQSFLSFGKDEVGKKLLNVYSCICEFESVPLLAAYKCDRWNLWQFVRLMSGEVPQ